MGSSLGDRVSRAHKPCSVDPRPQLSSGPGPLPIEFPSPRDEPVSVHACWGFCAPSCCHSSLPLLRGTLSPVSFPLSRIQATGLVPTSCPDKTQSHQEGHLVAITPTLKPCSLISDSHPLPPAILGCGVPPAPLGYIHWEPQNEVLLGSRVFVGVTGSAKMRWHSHRLGINPMTGVLPERGSTHTPREQPVGRQRQRAEQSMCTPRNLRVQQHQGPEEAGRTRPGACRGRAALLTPGMGTSSLQIRGRNCCCFRPQSVLICFDKQLLTCHPSSRTPGPCGGPRPR